MTDHKITISITRDELKDIMAEAFAEAVKRIVHDDDLSKKYWQRGFVELSLHTSNASSRWVGHKIMIAAATAALAWIVAYLVKNGAFR